MSLPKPELRGYIMKITKRHFGYGFVFSVACAFGWWYGVVRPHKIAYENFYKNYDAEKDFERMVKAGVFQSVKPDGSIGEGW